MSDLHKAGKAYKVISKSLDIYLFTVIQIVYKWRGFSIGDTLPRSGRPAKMTARAKHRMLNEVKKNPRVTAKGLKESFQLVNISVYESTMLKSLNRHGGNRKPLLYKKSSLHT